MSNVQIREAMARRDDESAMANLFQSLPYAGLRDEVAQHQRGQTARYDEASRSLHLLLVTPDIVACYTLVNIELDEGTAVLAYTENDGETSWSATRLLRAVEAVLGGEAHFIH